MPRIIRIVVVLAGLLAGPLFAQEKPSLVALALLTTNPRHYVGQTVATPAIVDESAPGKLKLTEVKTLGATEKAGTAFLAAIWSNGDGNPTLKSGQEAIVIGQVQMQNERPILQVKDFITGKEAIRRFLGSYEKRPRPGDNLGHDAQPTNHLAE